MTLLYRSPSVINPPYIDLEPSRSPAGLLEEFSLIGGNQHVVQGDGNPGQGRIMITQPLQPVGEQDRFLIPAIPVAIVDEVGELAFLHYFVDQSNGISSGRISFRRIRPMVVSTKLSIQSDFDPGMESTSFAS